MNWWVPPKRSKKNDKLLPKPFNNLGLTFTSGTILLSLAGSVTCLTQHWKHRMSEVNWMPKRFPICIGCKIIFCPHEFFHRNIGKPWETLTWTCFLAFGKNKNQSLWATESTLWCTPQQWIRTPTKLSFSPAKSYDKISKAIGCGFQVSLQQSKTIPPSGSTSQVDMDNPWLRQGTPRCSAALPSSHKH